MYIDRHYQQFTLTTYAVVIREGCAPWREFWFKVSRCNCPSRHIAYEPLEEEPSKTLPRLSTEELGSETVNHLIRRCILPRISEESIFGQLTAR